MDCRQTCQHKSGIEAAITNLKENWSFSPVTAEPQLRLDSSKTQTVIAELELYDPRY
jgi:hypothetical protein